MSGKPASEAGAIVSAPRNPAHIVKLVGRRRAGDVVGPPKKGSKFTPRNPKRKRKR